MKNFKNVAEKVFQKHKIFLDKIKKRCFIRKTNSSDH